MKRGERWNSRAQVTIFIILAIIIVAGAFLIYSFYPQIKGTVSTQEKSPAAYIQTCIESQLKDAVNTISLQGGSISPEHYIMYNNNKVEYLCYTDEFYANCVVQQPLLKQHIELEIKNNISSSVDFCFSSLKNSYEKQGYDVTLKTGDKKIELLPQRVIATFNYSLVLTKGNTQKYNSFVVMLDNNLYELVSIANSIIDWESTYGDADPTIYMSYYHNLKVEKKLSTSGDKVYVITDRDNKNKFEFASKSQVWPAGYYVDRNTTA